ncbi:MAG: ATP-binding cassette domain-containing protein [Candidatus Gracilibacteria bacterium]|nr:ATP-binding cassette domain-containing protein [Candidatus Gracilibacteria bacterium]
MNNFYNQNYTGYVEQREKVEAKKIGEHSRQEEYLLKQKSLINRFRAGSRAGWAKSREKMIGKMEKVDKPYIPRKPKFFFEYSGESGNKVINFREAFIGRKEPLFFIQEAILYQNQRVGIVGENGAGKSTLLKTIMREIDLLDGFLTRGKSLNIVYYSQMHEGLYQDLTIKQNFEKHGLYSSDQQLIGYLSHYLFDKEYIDKKVSDLSGGQKSKLLFSLLGQKECNLLIMDEPTNHLDYDTKEQLEKSLSEFKGTILFISHDRYFVNKLSTHIWFIEAGELSISTGTYADYKYKLEKGLDFDMSLFDEEANLDVVLEDKLGERTARKMKNKFGNEKSKHSKKVRK